MALTWADLGFAVAFNCGIAAACFAAFCVLRQLPIFYDFYNARRRLAIPFRLRPPRIPKGLVSWVRVILDIPDEHFARIAGFDGLAYVRYLGLCMRISASILLVSMVVLLPTNMTSNVVDDLMFKEVLYDCAETPTDQGALKGKIAEAGAAPASADPDAEVSTGRNKNCPPFTVTTFDKTSLTNVEEQSSKLWIYIIAIYAITIIVLTMLWTHFRRSINWRILYLSWLRRGDAGHTVLVKDIPSPMLVSTKGCCPGVPEVLYRDADVFSHQPKDIYKVQTDTVKPGHILDQEHEVEAGVSTALNAPSLIARLSSNHFVSRPAKTDLDTYHQVQAALESGLTTQDVVAREFERSFGVKQVEAVAVACDESSLAPLHNEYTKTYNKVRDLTDSWVGAIRKGLKPKQNSKVAERKPIKRNRVKLNMLGSMPGALGAAASAAASATAGDAFGGPGKEAQERFGADATDADEMEFNMWRMQTLRRQVEEEVVATRKKETQTAFVVFKTRQARASAATGLLHADGAAWKVSEAPAPNEVIWENISLPPCQELVGSLLAWGALITIIVFFIPIILFLQQIVNLQGYAKPGNWADFLLNAPVLGRALSTLIILHRLIITALTVIELLKAVMPTLALTIVIAVMPNVLRVLTRKVQRLPTKSAIDFEIGRKYYVFQFVVVFVFNVVIGAASSGKSDPGSDDLPIVTLFQALSDDPSQITVWLGTAVPQQASYFLTYLFTKGILAQAVQFLRIPQLAITFFLGKLSTSERAKKRTWSRQYMSYGERIPDASLCMLVMLVFSFVQPFIPLIALMYFVLACIYWRYDMLYSFRDDFQTGGMFWPVMFDQLFSSLIVAQLSAIGILGVKQAAGATLLLPLLIGTVVWRFLVASHLGRPLKQLSMHTAADLDRQDLKPDWTKDFTEAEVEEMRRGDWDVEDVDLDPLATRYVQPALKLNVSAHDRVLAEATAASRLADAYNKGEKVDGDRFLRDFSSTGPFEGVPDDVELEDTPEKEDLHSVYFPTDHDGAANGHAVNALDDNNTCGAPTPHGKSPRTPGWPDAAPRHHFDSNGDMSDVVLPIPDI